GGAPRRRAGAGPPGRPRYGGPPRMVVPSREPGPAAGQEPGGVFAKQTLVIREGRSRPHRGGSLVTRSEAEERVRAAQAAQQPPGGFDAWLHLLAAPAAAGGAAPGVPAAGAGAAGPGGPGGIAGDGAGGG